MLPMRCYFLIFFTKAYVVGTRMNCLDKSSTSTHNICFYKKVDKSTLTTKLLDCALVGAYVVIRSFTVWKIIPELWPTIFP